MKMLTAETLLQHYRPIQYPGSFFQKLNDILEQGSSPLLSQGQSVAENLFGTYVQASEQQELSKALRKISAVVWMTLFDKKRVSPAEYEKVHEKTKVDISDLKKMQGKMTRDGRACLDLAARFGYGSIFLVGDVPEW